MKPARRPASSTVKSVKTTESGGPKGYDAGKKILGRKRHIITDTLGFLVGLLIHTADIQDRDGAVPLLASIRRCYPWLRHVFADGGYAGPEADPCSAQPGSLDGADRQTIRHCQRLRLSCRGAGSSSARFAWLGRNRRLAKDFEKTVASGRSLGAYRQHPTHDAEAGKCLNKPIPL